MEHPHTQLYRGTLGWIAQPFVRRLRGTGLVHRHRAIWKLHRLMWRLTRSNRVAIHGHDLEVDRLDSLALAKGWYEPDETRWYEEHVRPGDLVIEAGANIGVFTLLLARLVGPGGRVVSYEPDPDLRSILTRNLRRNGYDNVIVRPYAVADESAQLTFYRARKNQGDNRLFSHGTDGATFPVQAIRLDDDLDDLIQAGDLHKSQVDMFKIDIQGAEPLAFAGFRDTLRSRPPRLILMEFWPHGIVGMGHDPRELVDLLLASGYSLTVLADGSPLDPDEALAQMTVENLEWVNVVATHREEPT